MDSRVVNREIRREVWPALREKSFAVNLGIYFRQLGDEEKTEVQAKPKECQCHFRRKLFKTIAQQNYVRKDIWYVDPEGLNLLEVVHDARKLLLLDGMGWFDRFSKLEDVLEILLNEDENDTLFGIGAKWSPHRKLLIDRAAMATGREALGA